MAVLRIPIEAGGFGYLVAVLTVVKNNHENAVAAFAWMAAIRWGSVSPAVGMIPRASSRACTRCTTRCAISMASSCAEHWSVVVVGCGAAGVTVYWPLYWLASISIVGFAVGAGTPTLVAWAAKAC